MVYYSLFSVCIILEFACEHVSFMCLSVVIIKKYRGPF